MPLALEALLWLAFAWGCWLLILFTIHWIGDDY